MPDQLQLRGGTTTEHNSFTGVTREVTVDTTKKTLVVHDGSTQGGTPLMKESGANSASSVNIGTGGTNRLGITSSEIVINENSSDTNFRVEGNNDSSLLFTDAGNDRIGIGTTVPAHKLHIRDATTPEIIVEDTTNSVKAVVGADNSVARIGSDTNHPLTLRTNDTERLRIDTSGNVSIGSSSGVAPLNVKAETDGNLHIRPIGTIASSPAGSGVGIDVLNDANSAVKDLALRGQTTIFRNADNETMRISSTGKVGIGTSTPVGLLHLHQGDSGTVDGVMITNTSTTNNGLVIGVNSTEQPFFWNGSNTSMLFATNNTERMRLTSTGKLGIGVSSPSKTLEVNGTFQANVSANTGSYTQGLNVTNAVNADFNVNLKTNSTSIGPFTSTPLCFHTGGTANERMRIDASGNLLVGSNFYGGGGSTPKLYISTTSDRAVKIHNTNTATCSLQLTNAFSGQGDDNGLQIAMLSNGDALLQNVESGSLRFSTSSSERMRISHLGTVGIGTSSPGTGYGLDITGLSGYDDVFRITGSGTNIGPRINLTPTGTGVARINATSNSLQLQTGGTTALTIDSSQKIGIGTTSPSYALHLVGNVVGDQRIVVVNSNTANTSRAAMKVESDSATLDMMATSAAYSAVTGWGDAGVLTTGSGTSGGLIFNSQASSSAIKFMTQAAERMRIHTNGRVSIGTTTADASLHIKSPDGGNGRLILEQTQDAANYQNGIDFKNAGTQYAGIVAGKDGNNNTFGLKFHTGASYTTRVQIEDTGALGFVGTTTRGGNSNSICSSSGNSLDLNYTEYFYIRSGNSTETLRADNQGRVSIGTTSAAPRLHVASNASTMEPMRIDDSNNTNSVTHRVSIRTGGNEVGSIKANQSATTFNTSSDYRLKENIVAISDGISRVKTLKPSRFNFKVDANTTVDGFIAHEVTAVPEAITGTKDAVVTQAQIDSGLYQKEELGDPIHQAIDQSKLVPLLTAALQEAIAKIETLETKVAALEAA